MNIVCLSDCHGTSRIPRSRIGNPLPDFQDKIRFVFEYAQEHNAIILQAGDLFDGPRDIAALYAFLEITEEFSDVDFYTIYGQHDLYFRNKDVLTNLNVLKRAGVITILNEHPEIIDNVRVYGCSWGEEIPEPKLESKLNILVIHAPIYEEMLFPGHEVIDPRKMLDNNSFDFILCGDIHRKFVIESPTRWIVNTGPLMRLEASDYMMQHIPNIIRLDTEDPFGLHGADIPCKSAQEVLIQNENIKEEHEVQEFDLKLKGIDVDKIDMLSVVDKLLNMAENKKGIQKVLKRNANQVDIKGII